MYPFVRTDTDSYLVYQNIFNSDTRAFLSHGLNCINVFAAVPRECFYYVLAIFAYSANRPKYTPITLSVPGWSFSFTIPANSKIVSHRQVRKVGYPTATGLSTCIFSSPPSPTPNMPPTMHGHHALSWHPSSHGCRYEYLLRCIPHTTIKREPLHHTVSATATLLFSL